MGSHRQTKCQEVDKRKEINRRNGPNKVMGNKQGQILRVFVIVVTAAPATNLTGRGWQNKNDPTKLKW
jgi:hypothetical protein